MVRNEKQGDKQLTANASAEKSKNSTCTITQHSLMGQCCRPTMQSISSCAFPGGKSKNTTSRDPFKCTTRYDIHPLKGRTFCPKHSKNFVNLILPSSNVTIDNSNHLDNLVDDTTACREDEPTKANNHQTVAKS